MQAHAAHHEELVTPKPEFLEMEFLEMAGSYRGITHSQSSLKGSPPGKSFAGALLCTQELGLPGLTGSCAVGQECMPRESGAYLPGSRERHQQALLGKKCF